MNKMNTSTFLLAQCIFRVLRKEAQELRQFSETIQEPLWAVWTIFVILHVLQAMVR